VPGWTGAGSGCSTRGDVARLKDSFLEIPVMGGKEAAGLAVATVAFPPNL